MRAPSLVVLASNSSTVHGGGKRRVSGISAIPDHSPAKNLLGTPLFDYFVGGGEHGLWERKTERFGRFQIDD